MRLFRKPKPPPPEIVKPTLTVEILPDGAVSVRCQWPQTEGVNAQIELSRNYGALLIALVTGRLNGLLRKGIEVAGPHHDMKGVSTAVLDIFDSILADAED